MRFEWEVDDGKDAAWLERLEKAGVLLRRLREVALHMPHKDGITALARKVRLGFTRLDHRDVVDLLPGSQTLQID
jgi:hypothetical protein